MKPFLKNFILLTISTIACLNSLPVSARTKIVSEPKKRSIIQSNLKIAQILLGDPNSNRFLPQTTIFESSNKQEPLKVEDILSQQEIDRLLSELKETEKLLPNDQFVFVSQIKIIDNTVLNASKITQIIQPYQGRENSLRELQQLAQQITQLYIEEGYIISKAVFSPENIRDNIVEIIAVEGSLEGIEIEGNRRLDRQYILNRLQHKSPKPFNIKDFGKRLRWLGFFSFIKNISIDLQPTSNEGRYLLILEIIESNRLILSIDTANYIPPSLGSAYSLVELNYLNAIGFQDIFGVGYLRSFTGELDLFFAGYRIPLNSLDGSLTLATIFQQERENNNSQTADIERYGFLFNQPVLRSGNSQFGLYLGLGYVEENLDTKLAILNFGQEYLLLDDKRQFILRSQFSRGIFNSNGFAWLGEINLQRKLGQNNTLIAKVQSQLGNKNSIFYLGGGDSVRGYQSNILSDNNGFRSSIDNRIAIAKNKAGTSIFSLVPFLDTGFIWGSQNSSKQKFIAGVGLGLLFEPVSSFNIRFDFAHPIIDLENAGRDLQDKGFYFKINFLKF